MRRFALATAAVAALSMTAPASAAVTLLVNGSGQLTGATGVTIGGATYDVAFLDGTCAALFDGCDGSSDFTFHSQSEAQAAAAALLGQVLIDGPGGQFDTDYGKTFGCAASDALHCDILIPFALNETAFDAAVARNGPILDSSSIWIQFKEAPDTSNNPAAVFAKFTLTAAAVPEPTSWAMMLLGFGAMGAALRQRPRLRPRGRMPRCR